MPASYRPPARTIKERGRQKIGRADACELRSESCGIGGRSAKSCHRGTVPRWSGRDTGAEGLASGANSRELGAEKTGKKGWELTTAPGFPRPSGRFTVSAKSSSGVVGGGRRRGSARLSSSFAGAFAVLGATFWVAGTDSMAESSWAVWGKTGGATGCRPRQGGPAFVSRHGRCCRSCRGSYEPGKAKLHCLAS
jgi:hypothetical protein